MTPDQREALDEAVCAFERDRDAAATQLETRRDFTAACVNAHAVGLTDLQLAEAFGEFSRSRIQQLRTRKS